ncbi:hypothetical protein M8J77_022891 [Diaphorina citri]|nr:hypothetical protein M8J77_022891 [Diaphorina citri]
MLCQWTSLVILHYVFYILGEVEACVCSNRVKCICLGDSYKNVTQMPLKYLTIADSDIELLNHDVMKMYANSLLDIYLTNVRSLRQIDENTFEDFSKIRTISIVNAPLLTLVSPNLLKHLTSLKIL